MILVTGGTGTSGAEIVRQLAAAGTPFRVMARNPEKAVARNLPGVQVVPGDLSKPETLPATLKGVDRLLLSSPASPNQVELESNMIRAARQAGVRHVVKLSAMTADPNSLSMFPRVHGQLEQQVRESGMRWTFLRPSFFMENLLGLAGMVKAGAVYQPAADGKAALVATADIAAVAVEALTEPGHEGNAYDITGPQLLSYDDIAATFSKVLRRPVTYQNIPPEVAMQTMLDQSMSIWLVEGISDLMAQLRTGEYARLSDAVEEVGKKEPVSLEKFIGEHAEVFKT
jgi:uncharacterized protein YbjT (DUF2867 family)